MRFDLLFNWKQSLILCTYTYRIWSILRVYDVQHEWMHFIPEIVRFTTGRPLDSSTNSAAVCLASPAAWLMLLPPPCLASPAAWSIWRPLPWASFAGLIDATAFSSINTPNGEQHCPDAAGLLWTVDSWSARRACSGDTLDAPFTGFLFAIPPLLVFEFLLV